MNGFRSLQTNKNAHKMSEKSNPIGGSILRIQCNGSTASLDNVNSLDVLKDETFRCFTERNSLLLVQVNWVSVVSANDS